MIRKQLRLSALALLLVLGVMLLPTSAAWGRPATGEDGGTTAVLELDAFGWLTTLWKSLTSLWSVEKATVTESTSSDLVVADPVAPGGDNGGQTDCTTCAAADDGGAADPDGKV